MPRDTDQAFADMDRQLFGNPEQDPRHGAQTVGDQDNVGNQEAQTDDAGQTSSVDQQADSGEAEAHDTGSAAEVSGDDPARAEASSDDNSEHADDQDSAEIDYSQVFPITVDGERVEMSLGEIKDKIQSQERMQSASDKLRERELAYMRDYQNFQQIVMASGVEVRPEHLEQLQKIDDERAQRGAQVMFETISAWRDPQTYQEDSQEIAEMLQDTYNFHPLEVKGMYDPRIASVMYDHLSMKRELEEYKARAMELTQKAKQSKASKANGTNVKQGNKPRGLRAVEQARGADAKFAEMDKLLGY